MLLAGTIGACTASSDSDSTSPSASASTCEEWNDLSLEEQRDVVVALYEQESSNPSQTGASAAVANVQSQCSQQPGLKLSSIDMDY